MKAKLTLVLIAFFAAAIWFAGRSSRKLERTKTALHALAAERTTLTVTTSRLADRLRAANAELAKLEQRIEKQAEGQIASIGVNSPAPGRETANQALSARPLSAATIIANDPQKMAEFSKEWRAMLDLALGGMCKALGLSGEQSERLKDLMLWAKQRKMDLEAVVEVQGLDPSGDAFKKINAEDTKTRMAKEDDLLGNLVGPYREYRRMQVARDLAQELAWGTVYSGEPVTSAQVEKVAQVLAANSQRIPSGPQRGWVKPNSMNWDAASGQLKEVLSSSQIATLGTYVQYYKSKAMLSEETNRLTAEFKARRPSPN